MDVVVRRAVIVGRVPYAHTRVVSPKDDRGRLDADREQCGA